MDRIERLVVNTYTQALLIAREKGLRGNDAREVAIDIVTHVVQRRTGQSMSERSVLEILGETGLTEDEFPD